MRRDRIDEHTTIDSCFAFGRLQWIMASNALYDVQVKTEGCLPEYNEARKNILKELAEAISDAIEEGIQPKEYSEKYQSGNEGGQTSKTGRCNSYEYGAPSGQEGR
jgi:hypothetical protein